MVRFLLFFFLISPLAVVAQFTYRMEQDIPVKDINGNIMPMPWAGGIDAAQYNTMDLDGDSKIDLVIFDRMADKILTFLNKNNQYIYTPAYEDLFPDDLSSWLILRDYNCDGKKDIFTGNIFGIKVYTNTTQPGENLSWKHVEFFSGPGEAKSEVLLTKGNAGLINLQLQYDDLPSISDVDNDGDLDIINMRYTGNSTVEFHKNFSKERYGSCDSLEFERQTQDWGNVTECACGEFAFNGDACPVVTRTKHAGGKSVLAIDADGDGDLDLLFSEASCNSLYLLRNDGTTDNPSIQSGDLFPTLNPISMRIFPSPYFEDVDFDGVRDLIASPNIYTKVYFDSDLGASNWFYKNTGTDQSPNFTFKKRTFLQDGMIDLGDSAVPAFADADGDGDYDLFVSESYLISYDRSLISFYENVGTASSPEFKLNTNDYLGFSGRNYYNLKIQFIDVTGDKKVDLVFTASSFNSTPILYYMVNTASSGLSFFGQPIALSSIQIQFDENIQVADVGGNTDGSADGLPDLLIGRNNGSMEYWENSGSLNFSLKDDSFLNLSSTVYRQDPSCAIGDLDGDTKADFILSDQSGVLTIVSDYHNATDVSAGVSDIVLSPLLDSTYIAHKLGGRTWPTIVNLFQTDKPAIVVGNVLGGLHILQNDGGRFQSEIPVIEIYPNPVEASATLNIKLDRAGSLQIFSSVGQQINQPLTLVGNKLNTYKVTDLARGMYLFRFSFGKKIYTKRIVVY